MKRFLSSALVFSAILCGLMVNHPTRSLAAKVEDQAVLQADHEFLRAIGKTDTAAVGKLLDEDFTWTDTAGKTLTREQVLQSLPSPATGFDAETQETTYGQVGAIQTKNGKIYFLRIWVKRPAGWRALVYHEVAQLAAPPAAGPGVKDCENPCKGIPYKPKNKAEQDIITSWQELETAVTGHDAASWAPHAAAEFVQVSSNNDHPLDKAARMGVLDKQKQTGMGAAPAPLVSAQMFDFDDTVVMTALHQPFHGKPIRVSRIWIKRDGQWVMAISYQTTIQAAPAKE
jgi:hypothetical protein